MTDLSGQVAMISGAGGPMGRAVAAALVDAGVTGLALTDISANRLAEAVDWAEARGVRVASLRADVTRADEADAFCNLAQMSLGGVDILLNLVGGIRSKRLYTPFLEMTEAQFRATMDLNLIGTFHLTQRVAPGMIARKKGRIINVVSIVFGGEAGQADYAAAKAGVASLTKSLAEEFAPYVTVNAVAPGLTRTSITENMPEDHAKRLTSKAFIQRMAEPEEIADAVAFLASDRARFITGDIISVSGGIIPSL
ncbi:SDR family oxidoreductase [Thalassobius vesicularis]|uniref:SDR family oxidoreductase n=1 Tax=Thalassobius vesicularis TaxID=1294297 RepID=A0A4S3M591_9RHOB|nr:SDR family oxidoreductase [Thalassobius vesicularis]THD71782.1 SDR family oxidoreductase [Thalassobius vesicularis]